MEVKTKLDEKMQREFMKKFFITGLLIAIVGSLCLITYFIVSLFVNDVDKIYLYCPVSLLTLGVVFIILYSMNIKNISKLNKENAYTFNQEFMEIKTIYHNEVEGTAKLYYSDAYKIKETKNYIFIYLNFQQAYPVLKSNVPNIEELKKLIYCKKENK